MKNKNEAAPQSSSDAGLEKLIRKLDRQERFKRRVAFGTLFSTAMLAPVAGIATDSYDLAPLPDCPPFTSQVLQSIPLDDAGQKVMTDLVDAPASNSSMVIQAVLISAGDESKMKLMDRALQIAITTEADPQSDAYGESCGVRSELRDIRMFNPALYEKDTYGEMKENPENYISFQAIAAYDDPESDNIMRAYFEPTTGTLTIATVGLTPDEGFERVLAVASENTDRVIPYDAADRFLNELRRTILEKGLTVNRTAIASHSMGTSGGILIKGMLESSKVNQLVFGKNPSLTLIEGFGESLAAQTISRELDIPMSQLTRNTSSLRSLKEGEANIVGHEWAGNQPIGEKTYAVHTTAIDTHALPDMAIGLLNGKRHITPYAGEFRTNDRDAALSEVGQWVGKVIKGLRDGKEAIGLS